MNWEGLGRKYNQFFWGPLFLVTTECSVWLWGLERLISSRALPNVPISWNFLNFSVTSIHEVNHLDMKERRWLYSFFLSVLFHVISIKHSGGSKGGLTGPVVIFKCIGDLVVRKNSFDAYGSYSVSVLTIRKLIFLSMHMIEVLIFEKRSIDY